MAQYGWKRKPKGAPDASLAGRYIKGLERRNKGISAELLVDESRSADSPLHDCFQWDDIAAASEHRKEQARLILRSLVVVIYESDDVEPVTVNAFVTFQDQAEYVSIVSVISDDDMDRKYKAALLTDLKSTRRKCEQYAEFKDVCQSIDRIRIR